MSLFAKIVMTMMLLHIVPLVWVSNMPRDKQPEKFGQYFLTTFTTTVLLLFLNLIWGIS